MRIDEHETTATLYTEGIALSCLTKDGTCHIAFFRPGDDGHGDDHQHTHKLELTIKRIDSDGEHNIPHKLNLNAGDKLVLGVENAIYSHCERFTPGDDFDRMSPDNHANDYRWVVDMENDIHRDDPLEVKGGRHPKDFLSTVLEVKNAKFYTETLTDFRVEKVSPGATAGLIFGKIANRVAAKIACKEGRGGVWLKNADKDNAIFLEKSPKVYYEISFKNERDDSASNNGDFPLFYGVLVAKSGNKFDLRKIAGKPTTVHRVCNRAELYRPEDLSQLASSLTKGTGA